METLPAEVGSASSDDMLRGLGRGKEREREHKYVSHF
jgi:hypothetical protein